jgi:hypothetical protein
LAACGLFAVAGLVGLIRDAQSDPHAGKQPLRPVVAVHVEEDLSRLSVGTRVHLCLAAMPCEIDVVRTYNRENTQQIELPLPSGMTGVAGDGWQLRSYAVVDGRIYRDTTEVHYYVSVDPPCHCAGDYAYVKLVPASYG